MALKDIRLSAEEGSAGSRNVGATVIDREFVRTGTRRSGNMTLPDGSELDYRIDHFRAELEHTEKIDGKEVKSKFIAVDDVRGFLVCYIQNGEFVITNYRLPERTILDFTLEPEDLYQHVAKAVAKAMTEMEVERLSRAELDATSRRNLIGAAGVRMELSLSHRTTADPQ
jgi:hypothetical protein